MARNLEGQEEGGGGREEGGGRREEGRGRREEGGGRRGEGEGQETKLRNRKGENYVLRQAMHLHQTLIIISCPIRNHWML